MAKFYRISPYAVFKPAPCEGSDQKVHGSPGAPTLSRAATSSLVERVVGRRRAFDQRPKALR